MAAGLTLGAASTILAGCGGNSASQSASQGGSNSVASAGGASTSGGSGASGGPIKIGFIPLTNCASVVMAHEIGLYKKYGVEVLKQPSWAILRDKLSTGELQVAHCLFRMPFSTALGVS